MNDTKNIIIAVLLSFCIIIGYEHFFGPKPEPETQQAAQKTVTAPDVTAANLTPLSREEALKLEDARIAISTPTLKGSLNLKGAQFDDLDLIKYTESTEPNSPAVSLLSPRRSTSPYNAHFGWIAQDPTVPVPTADSVWKASGTLTTTTPLTLTWDNGQGLTFIQEISLDDKYMFTVKQKVKNGMNRPVALASMGEIQRGGFIEDSGFFILHEGPVGVFAGKLEDPSYETILEDKIVNNPHSKAWLGFTDKYWLTALVPDQNEKVVSSYQAIGKGKEPLYIARYQRESMVIPSGQTNEVTDHFFAGAKILEMLDNYEAELGMSYFDKAVDFGWFYFMTKPIFYVLEWLKDMLGNFGLAILALTVIFKILFFPLANKSYHSMARMKTLQPKVQRLQELYSDDRLKLNEKTMELYKKEKVNPASGCAPMLIQIPVFFALYKVLFVSIEMRQAPFYGWIHDLSAPDPTSLFNLFGLIPWDPPSFLMIGIWPLVMGGTMLLQQKLSPPPGDPAQAKMMMILPVVFTIMLAQFPAGLVIYWAWNNMLSICQQWFIMRQDAAKSKR